MTYDISSQLLPPLHLKPSSKLRLHCRQDLTNSTLAKLPVTMARATLRRFMRIQWRAGRPIAWRTYSSQNISRQHKCSMMADCLGRPQDDDGMFKRKNEVTPKQGQCVIRPEKLCSLPFSKSMTTYWWPHASWLSINPAAACPKEAPKFQRGQAFGKTAMNNGTGNCGGNVLWCFMMFCDVFLLPQAGWSEGHDEYDECQATTADHQVFQESSRWGCLGPRWMVYTSVGKTAWLRQPSPFLKAPRCVAYP